MAEMIGPGLEALLESLVRQNLEDPYLSEISKTLEQCFDALDNAEEDDDGVTG